jgi:hypothetical protein
MHWKFLWHKPLAKPDVILTSFWKTLENRTFRRGAASDKMGSFSTFAASGPNDRYQAKSP